MKNNILLTMLIGLFLISIVSAGDYLPHQQETDLNFSVTSNFANNCTLTTINAPAGKIITISQTALTNQGTASFSVNGGNYSKLGNYCHNVFCTDGTDKTTGVVCYEVTLNGNTPAEGILVVIFVLVFIVVFSLAIFSLLNALQHVLSLDMDIKDTAFMMVSYFVMWMFYYFSSEYLGNKFINDILELAISIGAVTHVFLPLVGFMVSYIMQNLKFKQKQRVTY